MSYLGDKFDMNGTTEAQKIRTQEGYHRTPADSSDRSFVCIVFVFCG